MQSDLDRINRRVYATRGAVRQYGAAAGWIDAGEQRAVDLARAFVSGGSVLDLGIGGGRTVSLLCGLGSGYVGIDYTPALVAAARIRHPGAEIREMDARRLDFPDASFRLAFFSYNGIDSVDAEGRAAILREVWRVLEPGGAFVFSSLNRHGSAYGEQPWASWPLRQSALGMLRYLRRLVRGAFNKARHRRLFRDGDDLALSTISVHDFGMVTAFVSPPAQVKSLQDAGFIVVAVLDDTKGREVSSDLGGTTAPWLYYVARKPERAGALAAGPTRKSRAKRPSGLASERRSHPVPDSASSRARLARLTADWKRPFHPSSFPRKREPRRSVRCCSPGRPLSRA